MEEAIGEAAQVMRVIAEILEKGLYMQGSLVKTSVHIALTAGAAIYKKYKNYKTNPGKLPAGEQEFMKLITLMNRKRITPMMMQLDKGCVETFMEYADKNKLAYAFLPDFNTQDNCVELIYPSGQRMFYDIFMEKSEGAARPYNFSIYYENARDEDINAVKEGCELEYDELTRARINERINEALETGIIKVKKEQLDTMADGRLKVTLLDEGGKECFLIIPADSVVLNTDGADIRLDKNKSVLVKYPDRNEITIDKTTLLYDETADKYFTRVPRSSGKKYIFIDREEASEINEGRTIKTKLNMDKEYEICDKDARVTEKLSGSELYNTYYDMVATPIADVARMNEAYQAAVKKEAKTETEGQTETKTETEKLTEEETDIKEQTEAFADKEKTGGTVTFEVSDRHLKTSGEDIKLMLPEGDLILDKAAATNVEGHIFITLSGDKSYKPVPPSGKEPGEELSAHDVMRQSISYQAASVNESEKKQKDTKKQRENKRHDKKRR